MPYRIEVFGGPGVPDPPKRGVLLDGQPGQHHPADKPTDEFGWGFSGSGPRTLARALAHSAGRGDDDAYLDQLESIVELWEKDETDFRTVIP